MSGPLDEADAAVAAMLAQSDEEILRGSTLAEIDAAMGLAKDIARYNERANIIAYLRSGGENVRGLWVSWDSEMRAYAAAFADKIESGDHCPTTPSTEGQGA